MANPQKENGHIDIANEIADKLCSYRLSGEEWQVLWVILRKTYGWQKKEDWISLSQFATLTLIKKPNIVRALKKLTDKNIVIKKDNAVINTDNANGSYYAFNKDYDSWKPLSKKITLSKMIMPVIKKDNPALSKKIPTINNTTKDNNKERNIKERNIKERKIIFNNKTFKFENIPKEKVDKWTDAFPNLKVEQELKRMEAWLAANPSKHKKNYEKFIVNWLARGGNKNGKSRQGFSRFVPISAGNYREEGLDANAGEW